jgi:hypothetical protein
MMYNCMGYLLNLVKMQLYKYKILFRRIEDMEIILLCKLELTIWVLIFKTYPKIKKTICIERSWLILEDNRYGESENRRPNTPKWPNMTWIKEIDESKQDGKYGMKAIWSTRLNFMKTTFNYSLWWTTYLFLFFLIKEEHINWSWLFP